MNARPGAGSGLAGLLGRLTPALFACALLAAILALPARAAGETTTIGFDDLAAETVVGNQYAGKGLELGLATSFGQKELAAGDCGSPTVKEGTAFSPPKYALLGSCEQKGDPAAPFWSGTYGKLIGQPRGSVSVEMRDLVPAPPPRAALLTGYDSAGNVVASQEKTLAVGSWTQLAIAQPSGAKTISYFSIAAKETNSEPIAIDDLSFESEPPSTPPPPTKEAPKVVASIASLTPRPAPGAAISLTGAGSQPGGGRIVAYDWDLNGDGRIDTSTGANPVVQLILAPGVHTIGLTVTNSNKETSKSSFPLNVPQATSQIHAPDGGEGECLSTYDQGDIHIVAECIQTLKGGGYAISSRQVALNGMDLNTAGGGIGIFKIQTVKLLGIGSTVQMSGAPVNVELLNTPIGNVVLGGRDLEKEPITLAFEAFHPPSVKLPLAARSARRPGGPSAHAAGGGKTLVMAFAVAHKCAAGSKKAGCCPPQANTSCAELPGSFPLTGQVAVYLNEKGQSLIDVQVGLELKSVNFEATGGLEIIADRETGIELESLKFEIGEAGLAEIFKVSKASFTYYFPSDPEESKRDTWQAKGTISFGPLEQPAMEAELSFKKGEFHSASMVFTAPPGAGAMIYPGVEVNKIGASVGVNPLAFGGVLGAAIATQLELTLEFKFREATSTELGFFGGQGKLSYKGDDIATLAADVYSDGYTDAKLAIDIHFPFDSKEPVVEVGGGISFWDEPTSGLWQAEGNAHIKIWVISAEAAVLFNNQYIAGCLAAGEFGVQGRYRLSDGNIDGGFFGFKKCSDELKQYKQKPLVKHSGGFVGGEESLRSLPGTVSPWLTAAAPSARAATAGESQAFTLPGGSPGQELRIGFDGAAPPVHLKGPGGQVFTTPAAPGQFVTVGNEFIAAIGPGGHEVIVFLRKPKGGEWLLQSAAGVPIAKLETAQDVPPATIKARVAHKHGDRFSLSYKIANFVPGTHVRFVERGRDTTHVLGTAGSAHGTLAFTPQEGLSRPRTIEAYLLDAAGMPRRVLTVAHYSAPGAIRGGRVRKVKFVRHGSAGVIAWSATAGAREYRIKVRGGDGRVQTFVRKASSRSVAVTGLIPTDSYTVTVVARAGRNLLPGPRSSATLKALKTPKAVPVRKGKKKKKG
ncbi:MAG TPA: PKD domain-containing protein [Solirubrobacteraceae bacterium]|nr:PKD domain-containing protein [Solirubrobacteraceae bacterium]